MRDKRGLETMMSRIQHILTINNHITCRLWPHTSSPFGTIFFLLLIVVLLTGWLPQVL